MDRIFDIMREVETNVKRLKLQMKRFDRHKVLSSELNAADYMYHKQSINDLEKRKTIAGLLEDWDLVKIIGNNEYRAPLSQIKVLSYREKDDWILETKYNIGKKQVE